MPYVRDNERSEAIELIKLMDSIVRQSAWLIKSVGGESTLNTGKQRMFPDVILYGDSGRVQVLQGWEVKMPDVPITNTDFIEDAQRKADVLGVNSCFIWNYSCGVLYIKEDSVWHKKQQWQVEDIRSRTDVNLYRSQWENTVREILFTLNHYFVSGTLHSSKVDEILAENIFSTIISRNQTLVADGLKSASTKNTSVRAYISAWWRQVHLEYRFDKNDPFAAYADYALLNWINKFTFANLIKGWYNPASVVESITSSVSPADAANIFCDLSRKCDFYNIFSELEYANVLPAATWRDLTEYNAFLRGSYIAEVSQESLQMILEGTVSQFKRNTIGQFTTPEKLARILVRAGISDLTLPTIDPCCGTGTIAKTVLIEKESALGIEEAAETTYASDKYSFPLQISNISLTNVRAINIPALLFQANAFTLKTGDEIQIRNPMNGNLETHTLPAWGSVISNLPFVAFDQKGREEANGIREMIHRVMCETSIHLSGRIDLYQALLLKLWDTMADNASVAVITSNSWLGTASGTNFFRALNYYYSVESVIASGNGRWFFNADVIAVMLFLTRKSEVSAPNKTSSYSFGLIEKPLNDLSQDELSEVADCIRLKRSTNPSLIRLRSITHENTDVLLNMNVALNALFYDVSWLPEIRNCLRPVSDCFKIFRGIKTGQDEFYYLKNPSVADPPYVERILLNIRSVNRLLAEPDGYVFSCDRTVDELSELGHTRTVDYIRKFQNNINQSVPDRDTFWMNVRNGRFSGSNEIQLFTAMNPERRLFYGLLNRKCKINQRIIGLDPLTPSIDISLCHALLNSIIGIFYVEAAGFPRGLGVLDTSKERFKKVMMPDPDILTEEQVKRIMDAFAPLLQRNILPVSEELEMSDRNCFDHVVLSCYGIDSYYERIKSSLLEMQRVRLSVKKKTN